MAKNIKKNLKIALSTIAIIFSGAFIIWTSMDHSPRLKMEPYLALGYGMGEETIKLLGDKGGEVVVVACDVKKVKVPAWDAQRKAFADALKDSKVVIKTTEWASQEDSMTPNGMQMPGQIFLDVIKKYPDVAAIVSFIGPPELNDEQMGELGPRLPKCITNDSDNDSVRSLFENDIIQIMIIPSRTPHNAASDKKLTTLREWFDQYYQVVTVKNMDAILPES